MATRRVRCPEGHPYPTRGYMDRRVCPTCRAAAADAAIESAISALARASTRRLAPTEACACHEAEGHVVDQAVARALRESERHFWHWVIGD